MSASSSTASLASESLWARLKKFASSEAFIAWVFIFPSLVGFITFYFVPAVRGLLISFTDWDMLTDPTIVYFENYVDLLTDKLFWRSLQLTFYYVLLNIPLQTVLAIALAVMMDRVVKSTFIRSVFIFPWLLPPVLVAMIWLWMLDPQLGFVNNMLEAIGLNRQPFLGAPSSAMPSIALINIWQYTGYTSLLIFAGLQTIPKEVYEAASIDGAGAGRQFWSITLPLLRPVLVFVLVTTIIGSFQIFDTIAVTTQGGPVDATRVILWYIFEFAFNRFQMGYATAVSVVLFVILMAVTILQMRLLRANESDLA